MDTKTQKLRLRISQSRHLLDNLSTILVNLDTTSIEKPTIAFSSNQNGGTTDVKIMSKAKLIGNALKDLITTKHDYIRCIPLTISKYGINFLNEVEKRNDEPQAKWSESDLEVFMLFVGFAAFEYLTKNGTFDYREKNTGFTFRIESLTLLVEYFLNSSELTDAEKNMRIYSSTKLVYDISEEKMKSDINRLRNEINLADEKVLSWESKIESFDKKFEDVKTMEVELEEQKKVYNFLGLSKSFSEFHKTKVKAKKLSLWFTIVLGVLLISPPIYMTLSSAFYPLNVVKNISVTTNENNNDALMPEGAEGKMYPDKNQAYGFFHSFFKFLPIIGFEIILLYFFRILLQNYKSSSSQVMQLQMRNSICQFIEDYVKFKDNNKEHKGSFEKFESLIFSGLAPNDESILATFDGADQLNQLLKTLKGS